MKRHDRKVMNAAAGLRFREELNNSPAWRSKPIAPRLADEELRYLGAGLVEDTADYRNYLRARGIMGDSISPSPEKKQC